MTTIIIMLCIVVIAIVAIILYSIFREKTYLEDATTLIGLLCDEDNDLDD